MKTGILLINIGTPAAPTPAAVRQYLKVFLSDRRVVEIPRLVWWPILHGIILRFRPKHSAALYQKIWTMEGSPLLTFSKKITEKLAADLNIPVALGMNYGNPTLKQGLAELKECEKIIVLPLFPQYSATTTAATFDRIAALFKKQRNLPHLQFIKSYYDNPAYIQAITNSIHDFWQKHGRAQHLLFSFHGIPERFIKSGDPYAEQCQITAKRIAETLQIDNWSISFQSRLGRAKWLSPYTEQVLKELPQKGIHHLQVICPGFSVDCLETLEEIAMRGKEQFLTAGGKIFQYIPALNDSDEQVTVLKNVYLSL